MRNWFKNLFGKAESRNHFPTGGFLQPLAIAGVPVTPETAINCSTVYAAINAIATDLASLPFITYQYTGSGGKVRDTTHSAYDILAVEANAYTSSFNFERSLMMNTLSWGDGYGRINRDNDGELIDLHLLDSKLVKPEWRSDGVLVYKVKGRDGKEITLLSEEVIHISCIGPDGIKGYSPILLGKQTIGLAQAAEIYGASFFGNSAIPAGWFKTPQGMTKEARQELRQEVDRVHGGPYEGNKMGALPPGVEWVATSIPPEAAQFLATRQFSVIEVARWFGINPVRLQDYSQSKYSTVEQAVMDYVTNTLRPWCETIEAEFNRKLFSKEERKKWVARHDLSAYMRGDKVTQSTWYKNLFDVGAYTQNDILIAEDMNPIGPLGDKHYLPVNNLQAVEDIANQPVEEPAEEPIDLNGLLAITSAVTAGTLPVESARGLIEAAYPDLSADQVEAILAPLQVEAEAEPVEPIEPPAPAEEVPPVPAALSPDITNAVRGVLVASLNRMVRRQVEGVRRAAKKDDFLGSTEEFFRRHSEVFAEAIKPSLDAYALVMGRKLDIDVLSAAVLKEDRSAVEAAEDLEALLGQWEVSRAEDIVKSLEVDQ